MGGQVSEGQESNLISSRQLGNSAPIEEIGLVTSYTAIHPRIFHQRLQKVFHSVAARNVFLTETRKAVVSPRHVHAISGNLAASSTMEK